MSNTLRLAGTLCAFLLAVAGVVYWTTELSRAAAAETVASLQASDHMLTAALARESALRGYGQTRRTTFLAPYDRATEDLADALDAAREHARGDADQLVEIDALATLARRWAASAADAILELRSGGEVDLESALARSDLISEFRFHNRELESLIAREADADHRAVVVTAFALVGVLGLVFAILSAVLLRRHRRQEEGRRETDRRELAAQQEFAETLQVTSTEAEALTLVKRHIERTVGGSDVLVLNRNRTQNRLEAVTPLPADSPVARRLAEAAPASCLAVRLGRVHAEAPEDGSLLSCGLCSSGRSTCTPLLVGGEVIGAVRVDHERAFSHRESAAIAQSVAQAAPVLANLRNLAVAEVRAATDELTGLANARALRDSLKRMLAQADRSGTPLSVVLCDLDHFKQINDVYGHETGDHALAAAAAALAATVRESDLAGRYGGEEFLLLLPDTNHGGALVAAEKLREAVERVAVAGVERPITASFGVASFPADGLDADALLRIADRALYAAKARGRNCVVSSGELEDAGYAAGAAGSSSEVRSISRVS
jgi:diguanylate cyclase (GGDEF)-like protein